MIGDFTFITAMISFLLHMCGVELEETVQISIISGAILCFLEKYERKRMINSKKYLRRGFK